MSRDNNRACLRSRQTIIQSKATGASTPIIERSNRSAPKQTRTTTIPVTEANIANLRLHKMHPILYCNYSVSFVVFLLIVSPLQSGRAPNAKPSDLPEGVRALINDAKFEVNVFLSISASADP